jgi:dienelactone hydrolase
MLQFNEKQYIANLLEATSQQFNYRLALETGRLSEWRSAFRTKLTELTGLDQVRESTKHLPLNARKLETKQFETYSREKWLIATEPGVDIPFYLLMPHSGNRLPLVLTPHGHGLHGKELYVGNVPEKGERDVALQAVNEGYAVIAPDVRGFGEMMNKAEGRGRTKYDSCREFQRIAMLFGRTLIGERIHDMGRLIDFAETISRIDTGKIAITGNSGGGTVSLFTAALDHRISVAVPSCYFCTFCASIVSLVHCPCNVVPGLMKYGEMYDVAGLFAPKPILIVSGEHDEYFPIEGTRNAFAHLQQIYSAYGASLQCELYVGKDGHRYYKERVWSFVREQFSGEPS